MGSTDFVIANARVFDGEQIHQRASVLVAGGRIEQVGETVSPPAGTEVIDGTGKTLLPGLIDAHAHAQPPALEYALLFGVTTELDMFSMPEWMDGQRADAASRDDMADVRSASAGATVRGRLEHRERLGEVGADQHGGMPAADAPAFVETRVKEGADYIKLLIDDGTALGHLGPSLTEDMARAVVQAGHAHGKMVVAHATSLDGMAQAIRAGVDGLVHVFFDQPPTDQIIAQAVDAGVFVTPTLSTVGSLASDIDGTHLAQDGLSLIHI